jgi:hypothetical protein
MGRAGGRGGGECAAAATRGGLDRPRRVNAEAELRHAGVVLHNEPLVSPYDTEAAEPEVSEAA